MPENLLNEKLLPGNVCFGCGQENPLGLRIAVELDPTDSHRLLGTFEPQEHMIGFPSITHGGAIYTAMDCMATWSGMVLRRTKAMWLLRSATVKYHRPALQHNPISLSAVIEEEGEAWEAILVRIEARNPVGELLADGHFKVIPVAPERLKELTGLPDLPGNWIDWLNSHVAGGA